jgi:hydroxymethylbilane synthase
MALQTVSIPPQIVKIGTRGSPLALAQAHIVATELQKLNIRTEIVAITTSGDRFQDKKLAEIGGKSLFTKEIEDALIEHQIDLAVHSMKDVETTLPEPLTIPCILEREDPREALITRDNCPFAHLPHQARLGTSSVRRAAQALALRPDLTVVPFRGNIDTRLRKLQEGQAEATFLAFAGLKRLQKEAVVTELIDVHTMIPAAGQGAIGLECRKDDPLIIQLVTRLNHLPSFRCVMAERALLTGLAGTCDTPVGVYAQMNGQGLITLFSIIMTPNGHLSETHTLTADWPQILTHAHQLGEKCRLWLLKHAPEGLS